MLQLVFEDRRASSTRESSMHKEPTTCQIVIEQRNKCESNVQGSVLYIMWGP